MICSHYKWSRTIRCVEETQTVLAAKKFLWFHFTMKCSCIIIQQSGTKWYTHSQRIHQNLFNGLMAAKLHYLIILLWFACVIKEWNRTETGEEVSRVVVTIRIVQCNIVIKISIFACVVFAVRIVFLESVSTKCLCVTPSLLRT